jgi:hypothetical protein|tara:strand:+ start:3006 stop:3413 length:408 start_codon:yes stop_codon:yes gene_type:complete
MYRTGFTLFMVLLVTSNAVFAASPRINYLLYCSGCHRPTGESYPPNVPTLLDELGMMLSVPQMRSYLVRVPGSNNAPIDDEALTGVLNWILQEFNADTLPDGFQELSTAEVSAARADLLADPNKYRETYWKAYDF